MLDVVTGHTAAVELYERQGWEWLMTVDQQWPDGQVVPVHCYALDGALGGALDGAPDGESGGGAGGVSGGAPDEVADRTLER